MDLRKIAHIPPITVGRDEKVAHAVRLMVEHNVGAVAVVQESKLVGILTERDIMKKVNYRNLSVEELSVSEIMGGTGESIRQDMPAAEALKIMLDGDYRHLPIVDRENNVTGVLPIRVLLRNQVEDLEDSVNTLSSYYSADGPGG